VRRTTGHPIDPSRAEDVRYLWDEALARVRPIERSHLFEVKLGLGVHTWSRVENVEELLAALPGYLELDVVAAVGEIGVTKSQHVHEWDLDAQREVVTEQMRIADEYDTPVILHTPPTLNEESVIGSRMPVYEVDLELLQEPVLNEAGTSLQGTKIDVECARAAGLPEEKVVVSHADPTITEYVMESTDCYLSFTVGYPWLTGVTAADVADAVETYGPDRIMIDTDCAGVIKSGPLRDQAVDLRTPSPWDRYRRHQTGRLRKSEGRLLLNRPPPTTNCFPASVSCVAASRRRRAAAVPAGRPRGSPSPPTRR